MNQTEPRETFEQLMARFPAVDEAGRRRAAMRIEAGADAAQALNDEFVWDRLTKAYN